MRRFLPRIAGTWLLLQLAGLVCTPTALCATMRAAASVDTCTCSHDDGQTCPMHHPVRNANTKSCSCTNSSSDSTGVAAIASMIGTVAVVTSGSPLAAPADCGACAPAVASGAPLIPPSPTSPPPRG
jgi:hypothetical protein